MDTGRFALISRSGEWDEVLLVLRLAPDEWLCYTTGPSGLQFHWTAIKIRLGGMRVLLDTIPARLGPADVDDNQVNWMMHPPPGL